MLTKFLQNHLYRQQESSKRQTLQSILLLMSLSQTCRPWSKHLVSWGQGDALVSQSQSPKSWKYGAMQLEKKKEKTFHSLGIKQQLKVSTKKKKTSNIALTSLVTVLTPTSIISVLVETNEHMINSKLFFSKLQKNCKTTKQMQDIQCTWARTSSEVGSKGPWTHLHTLQAQVVGMGCRLTAMRNPQAIATTWDKFES